MQNVNQVENKAIVKAKWIRGLYMLIFLVCGWVAVWLAIVITIFQFLSTLLTDNANDNLCKFGKSLGSYFSQIMDYLTYNTEHKPFPFSAWPGMQKLEKK